jgi:hypothetical protein
MSYRNRKEGKSKVTRNRIRTVATTYVLNILAIQLRIQNYKPPINLRVKTRTYRFFFATEALKDISSLKQVAASLSVQKKGGSFFQIDSKHPFVLESFKDTQQIIL